jgi:hypothetical protein
MVERLIELAFHHPERLLMALTAGCLFSFLLMVPIPRVDNQLVGSDGIRYYVYLPSLIIDGDLDFTDEYTYFYAFNPGKLERVISDLTPQGIPSNQWPIGPAILWAPFFVLAHMVARLLILIGMSVSTYGYGYLYQSFVLSGSILYGGAALLLTYRFVHEFATEYIALVSTVLIAFAGNLVYYMVAEPSMPHTLSAFTSSLFFYTWWQWRGKSGVVTALLYGSLGGVMALVRPQDGLFLMLPYLARVPVVWRSLWGGGLPGEWHRWLRDVLIAGVVAFIVFSPQMIVWGQIYGDYFRSPYVYQQHDQLFFWLSPRLGAVLFSAYRGLFTWHPVFLPALIGLLFTYKRQPTLAVLGFLGFAIQWYLVSSWHSWYQGDAFGGRMFIVCTPIFALGLADLIRRVTDRVRWRMIYIVASFLLVWNFLLLVEYRLDLVTAQRIPTWYDITVGRIAFLIDTLHRVVSIRL